MLGEKEAKRILDQVLSISQADQTEALLLVSDSALTRFANNYIHQNMAESNATLSVRLVFGKKIGIASTNSLIGDSIQKVVEQATELARFQPDNPDFVSLPKPSPGSKVNAFVDATADFTPDRRAEAVNTICRRCKENDLTAAGAFSVTVGEMAVANSLGIFAYHPSTSADINIVTMADSGSGHADYFTKDVREINAEALAAEAVDKALRSRNPISLDPGEYEVILEEYAVSDILDQLAYLGFSALAVQEGRSFMGGRFGERIMNESISIWDDGLAHSTVPIPFDFEGVPKQRLDIITNGVAKAVCYDSYTAHKERRESTGHALPPGETFGPVPLNMFMGAGSATKEDMLAGTERGIWVTRFHYTRPVHPLQTVITGMTRDGTFQIEKGEITRPVKNFRYTQSYLEALNDVQMISKNTKLEQTMFAYNRVPALKIARWNFTGVTEF